MPRTTRASAGSWLSPTVVTSNHGTPSLCTTASLKSATELRRLPRRRVKQRMPIVAPMAARAAGDRRHKQAHELHGKIFRERHRAELAVQSASAARLPVKFDDADSSSDKLLQAPRIVGRDQYARPLQTHAAKRQTMHMRTQHGDELLKGRTAVCLKRGPLGWCSRTLTKCASSKCCKACAASKSDALVLASKVATVAGSLRTASSSRATGKTHWDWGLRALEPNVVGRQLGPQLLPFFDLRACFAHQGRHVRRERIAAGDRLRLERKLCRRQRQQAEQGFARARAGDVGADRQAARESHLTFAGTRRSA